MGEIEKQIRKARLQRALWGLPSPNVEPGHSITLTLRSPRPLRIRSILVDYASADAFDLENITIGQRQVAMDLSLFPVPLSMMGTEVEGWPRAREIGPGGDGVPALWDGPWLVVQHAEDVGLSLTNTSQRPACFRGVLQVETAASAESTVGGWSEEGSADDE